METSGHYVFRARTTNLGIRSKLALSPKPDNGKMVLLLGSPAMYVSKQRKQCIKRASWSCGQLIHGGGGVHSRGSAKDSGVRVRPGTFSHVSGALDNQHGTCRSLSGCCFPAGSMATLGYAAPGPSTVLPACLFDWVPLKNTRCSAIWATRCAGGRDECRYRKYKLISELKDWNLIGWRNGEDAMKRQVANGGQRFDRCRWRLLHARKTIQEVCRSDDFDF
ncbi:hypothetical protein ACLOJK_011536 [Asimina triloba]